MSAFMMSLPFNFCHLQAWSSHAAQTVTLPRGLLCSTISGLVFQILRNLR